MATRLEDLRALLATDDDGSSPVRKHKVIYAMADNVILNKLRPARESLLNVLAGKRLAR